jgi:DNA-directed RNA polymerase specialized sigma24 family protein
VVAGLLAFVESTDRDKGRAFIRGVVIHKLYGRKPPKKMDVELIDELTQLAALRALRARMPPWTKWGIPGWVARVTKRAIVDYFRSRERDKKYLEPDADVAELPFDRHAPHTDWGAREHLIAKYMEGLIGHDPRKKRTFALMMEKEVVGRSIEELAAQEGTTPNALSLRFSKLRKELIPKISVMDEEKPRRAFILFLLFLCLGAVVAIVVLWRALSPPPIAPEPPAPLPSATAAPTSSLDDIAAPPEGEDDGGIFQGPPPKR